MDCNNRALLLIAIVPLEVLFMAVACENFFTNPPLALAMHRPVLCNNLGLAEVFALRPTNAGSLTAHWPARYVRS